MLINFNLFKILKKISNNIQFCIIYLESKNKQKINGKKKFVP